MSSLSSSFTVPIPTSEVEAATSAMLGDDESLLFNSIYVRTMNLVLDTYSDRAETEWYVANLIRAFQPPGLDYLGEGFKILRSTDPGQWYAHALRGPTLLKAIDGLHLLLANLHRFQEVADEDVWGELDDRELALLSNPPLTIADAIARNKQANTASGGIGTYAVIPFLQGHLALLEYARDNALGAIYCVRED
nr:hypothetical protein [Rhodoferax sp.]